MDKKILNDSELKNVSGGISEVDEAKNEIMLELEMERRRASEEALKAQGYSDEEIYEILHAPKPDFDRRDRVIPIIFT